jgi:hypothetical protein
VFALSKRAPSTTSKADIASRPRHVRFTLETDIKSAISFGPPERLVGQWPPRGGVVGAFRIADGRAGRTYLSITHGVASWLSRIGAYIWWEISPPDVSEPSKLWTRLVSLLRSGCRHIFRARLSQTTKRCRGRKT